jgi:DNA-binding NarL/FixJ family response regulator
MIRILLADDQIVVRRGLRSVLEERPDFMVCAETGDGREAAELALSHKPDVVVLDISLPLLNGIEVARQIRKGSPGTEVLVFTAHDDDAVIGDVLHAGARGYLFKSETGAEIINAITALTRHLPYFSARVSETLLEKFNSGGVPVINALSAREREVLQLIAEGNSNKKIARELGISVKTVESHRAAVRRKLNVQSSADLVRYAVRNKIIQA